jgi:hypothetical protein
MKLFKISAEHVSRKRGETIRDHLEDVLGLNVYHAGMDDTFGNFFHVVFEGDGRDADRVQNYIWAHHNGGAYCAVQENWTEEMDPDASWL